MGTAINHRSTAQAHHHHRGLEYIIAGVCVVLLFATFAVLQSYLSGHFMNPIYIGVVFGAFATAMGAAFWYRH